MRSFARGIECISDHAESSAAEFDWFSKHKPNNVFSTRGRSETAHVLVVTESAGID